MKALVGSSMCCTEAGIGVAIHQHLVAWLHALPSLVSCFPLRSDELVRRRGFQFPHGALLEGDVLSNVESPRHLSSESICSWSRGAVVINGKGTAPLLT